MLYYGTSAGDRENRAIIDSAAQMSRITPLFDPHTCRLFSMSSSDTAALIANASYALSSSLPMNESTQNLPLDCTATSVTNTDFDVTCIHKLTSTFLCGLTGLIRVLWKAYCLWNALDRSSVDIAVDSDRRRVTSGFHCYFTSLRTICNP